MLTPPKTHMKITTEQPSDGQFVMIWKSEGSTWSAVLRYAKDGLEEYDHTSDTWGKFRGETSHDGERLYLLLCDGPVYCIVL